MKKENNVRDRYSKYIIVNFLKCLLLVQFSLDLKAVTADPQIITNKPTLGNDGMPQIRITGEYRQFRKKNETRPTRVLNIKDKKDWIEFNVKYSSEHNNTILGHAVERFTINCTAPYLTRWTSNIVPRLPAKYGHANRYDHNPFIFQVDGHANVSSSSGSDAGNSEILFQSQIVIMLPNGTSGFIQCESVTNSSWATKVFLFVQDGEPFVKLLYKDEFQPPIITDTRSNFYIPCVANYPHLNATLFKVLNYSIGKYGKDIQVNDSEMIGSYDPQRGFLLKGNENVEQHYRCRIAPGSGKKDTLAHRALVYFYNPELNEVDKASDFQFHIGSTEDQYPLGIWCSLRNETRNQIKMITCNSQYECDWLNTCFYDSCTGNEITRLAAIPNQRDKSNLSAPKANGTITNPYSRGKVICVSRTNSGVVRYDYLFTGLDRHRYWLSSNAHEIPKNAIIYVSEIEPLLYTNKPAHFACDTSNFVLLSNIKFAVLFKNGTKLLLDKLNSTKDPAILVDNDLGFSRKEIVTNVTKEMVAIICLAPLLNSSQWVDTSRTFEARDVRAPSINTTGNKANKFTFYEGDKTRSLFCNATGEPRPSVKWTVPHELSLLFVELDDPTLHFPKIDSSLKGNYMCTATNLYGNDTLNFDVDVKSPITQLGAASISGIVLAFLVLTTGLAFAIKKYKEARDELRKLTPEEMGKFLEGNPDVSNNRNMSADSLTTEERIESRPFDPAHKINPADLSLEESTVLGNGNFGKVIQGRLKGRPVAVKITKPNTGVSYFLALLSELKIMAYVGVEKHPNIIEFLGAVVSDIAKRKVFVVVELSPLGNLHSYLVRLGCTPGGFLDLLNEDGAILSHGRSSEQIKREVSVFNFVSWCVQIASGMEYLASKKVIHADLAARNILMFENDIVKITDFGLSKKLYQSSLYKKKNKDEFPIPAPWMAIESLQFNQFSSQSDVWSFAVTVWEIFSLGEFPYTEILENDFLKNLKAHLRSGKRLEKPSYASQDIFNILRSCWELDPVQRPSFTTLKNSFGDVLKILTTALEEQLLIQQEQKAVAVVNINPHYVTYLSTDTHRLV